MSRRGRTTVAIIAVVAGLSVLGQGVLAVAATSPELPPGAVILTAMVKARPGQEAAVKEALLSLVEPTRKESGCLLYNLHQSKSDPTQFLFYEQWASQEALTAHGQRPHMKALGAKLAGKTEKGGGVVLYELVK